METEASAQPTTELRNLNLWPPVRVPKGTPLREVASVMRNADISTVLVGEDGSVLATERDLIQALADGRSPETPIDEVASKDPVWAPADLHLAQAAAMMVRFGVRHLVVRYPDGAAAVLSMRDAFGILVRQLDPRIGWLVSFRHSLHL